MTLSSKKSNRMIFLQVDSACALDAANGDLVFHWCFIWFKNQLGARHKQWCGKLDTNNVFSTLGTNSGVTETQR